MKSTIELIDRICLEFDIEIDMLTIKTKSERDMNHDFNKART